MTKEQRENQKDTWIATKYIWLQTVIKAIDRGEYPRKEMTNDEVDKAMALANRVSDGFKKKFGNK